MDNLPPEIVLQILRTLKNEENNIAPLLRLNWQWFNCGISVLWGDGCPGEGKESQLAKVHDDRRQIYAPVIRSITLRLNQGASLAAFRYLIFPKLFYLAIFFGPFEYEDDQSPGSLVLQDKLDLQPYLHSGLRHLWVAGPVDADLLAFPDTLCSRLRTLYIDNTNAHPHQTLEVLSKVLPNNATVSDMSLTWRDPAESMPADLFNILAKQNNLRYLTTDGYKSERSDAAALGSTMFRPISKLTGLHSLKISIQGSTGVMSNEDLLSLGSLTQLRQLNLLSNDSSSFQAPHFTDGDFERLVANFPHLQRIQLRFTGSMLTTVCLSILGKHCASLRSIYLAEHFDVMVLNPEKVPLIPHLEYLAGRAFVDTESDISAPEEHVLQIERLFPRLHSLEHIESLDFRDLPRQMDFSHWIIYYWEKRHKR